MPRILSAAQALDMNQLESEVPWKNLIELTIPTQPPYRFVNHIADVVFQGNTFQKASFRVPGPPEHATDRVQRLSASIGNATREIIALAELYWGTGDTALWEVKIWRILLSSPNDTDIDQCEIYDVLGVNAQHNSGEATFDLRAQSLSGTRTVPALSVTRASGFRVVIR